jgi:hypothetical protein
MIASTPEDLAGRVAAEMAKRAPVVEDASIGMD